MAVVANAQRQPCPVMIQVSTNAAVIAPTPEAIWVKAVGRLRSLGGNQLCAVCTVSGLAGPSAAPMKIRLMKRAARVALISTGTWASAQSVARTTKTHLLRTLFAIRPTRTEETV